MTSLWQTAGASALGVVIAALVLTFAAFLLRTWIKERVRHSFDLDLEKYKDDISRRTAQQVAMQMAANAGLTEAQRVAAEWRVRAVESLWLEIVRLSDEATNALLMLDILDPSEYQYFVTRPDIRSSVLNVNHSKLLDDKTIDRVRPILGERLYSLCFMYRAILGRIWFLLDRDIRGGHINAWFEESVILQQLNEVLGAEEMDRFKSLNRGHFTWTRNQLQAKILEELRSVVAGTQSIDEGLVQAARILETAQMLTVQAPEMKMERSG